jgi:hypothetical protein
MGNACGASGTYVEYFLAGTEGSACGAGVNPFSIEPQRDTGTAKPAAITPPAPPAAKPKAAGNPFKIPGA